MGQPGRILVVDDDEIVGRSINRVLGGRGHTVREASSGIEALEELGRREYDLVLTDIRMPGMNGLDLAARVKRGHPGTSILVITGYGTTANEMRAGEIGVAGFLRKPLSPGMIVESAERALQERSETMDAIGQSALSLLSPEVAPAPEIATKPVAGAVPGQRESVAGNLALFFAAPFIGLAYVLAFPLVGAWAIAKYGCRALFGRR